MGTLLTLLWVADCIAIALVPAAMLSRKTFKAYRLFFAYVSYQALVAWTLLAAYHAGTQVHSYVFWVSSAGEVVLSFAVLREIFLHIFRPYESLREFGNVLFRWAAVVLVIIAIVMAMTSNHPDANFTSSFLMTLARSILMMQCGLVIFMFLFAPHLGLTPRHHLFGIAIGFGITASCNLISATLLSYGVCSNTAALSAIKMIAEIVSFGLWAYYMITPEPERRAPTSFAHAQNWNLELSRLHNTPEAAFLPNIVDTVERVLSRRTATEIYMHTAGGGPSLPN